MRRAIGAVLAASGAITLLWTGGTWVTGAIARDRARAEWDMAEAHAVTQQANHLVSASMYRMHPAAIGSPVARLEIPAIGLDEVVIEGVDSPQLNAGPGHLPGTPLPGETGNAIVSAHRDRHFHALGDLETGDTILTIAAGKQVTWRVVSTRVVNASAPALFSSPSATLTLTTCWPVSYFGPAPDRLIVVAKPVELGAPRA